MYWALWVPFNMVGSRAKKASDDLCLLIWLLLYNLLPFYWLWLKNRIGQSSSMSLPVLGYKRAMASTLGTLLSLLFSLDLLHFEGNQLPYYEVAHLAKNWDLPTPTWVSVEVSLRRTAIRHGVSSEADPFLFQPWDDCSPGWHWPAPLETLSQKNSAHLLLGS